MNRMGGVDWNTGSQDSILWKCPASENIKMNSRQNSANNRKRTLWPKKDKIRKTKGKIPRYNAYSV